MRKLNDDTKRIINLVCDLCGCCDEDLRTRVRAAYAVLPPIYFGNGVTETVIYTYFLVRTRVVLDVSPSVLSAQDPLLDLLQRGRPEHVCALGVLMASEEPFHSTVALAASQGNAGLVRMLLSCYGDNFAAFNYAAGRALDMAMYHKHYNVLAVLLAHKHFDPTSNKQHATKMAMLTRNAPALRMLWFLHTRTDWDTEVDKSLAKKVLETMDVAVASVRRVETETKSFALYLVYEHLRKVRAILARRVARVGQWVG